MTEQEAYVSLAKKILEHNKNFPQKKMTVCPSIKGSDNAKIMVVGRAINGWCMIPENAALESVVSRIEKCKKCTLNWVTEACGDEKCILNKCGQAKTYEEKTAEGRNPKSALKNNSFWRFVRFYCKEKGIDVSNNAWVENIIWSNLYKASFSTGNPTTKVCKEIKDNCDAILLEEIKKYKPTEILFITRKKDCDVDESWFCEEYFPKTYNYLKENKDVKAFSFSRPENTKFKEVLKYKKEI